jgi:glycyl-tRNA synthetase beta chain
MTDFLLELRSEEIPARMQDKAREDLARLFSAELDKAGLKAGEIVTFATPRRLALIAKGLPLETQAVSEETKGPKVGAPPQAMEGFLRKVGLTQDQLVERDGVYFAVVEKPGRKTAELLAEAIPAIIRAFPWPKSQRWGAASASTESLRWVRPLQGIVALLGDDVVACEIDGIVSGSATMGHRFMRPPNTVSAELVEARLSPNRPSTGSGLTVVVKNAGSYAADLRACHVIVDQEERRAIIRAGAEKAAADAGLLLVSDEGLVNENSGLTEWPVPMLGRFDPAFLAVPQEVIQLTARVNQKYFVLKENSGTLSESDGSVDSAARQSVPEFSSLANAFVCTANIAALDGGVAIVAGNEKVLAARLSDAKFFWEQDLKVALDVQAEKLAQITFHEKLGTVADKVERVAKLARWLVEEGIVPSKTVSPEPVEGRLSAGRASTGSALTVEERAQLATQAERAARLCKADLVTGMVGEFPELQGIMGGYYARAQGEADAVADAVRDHYKPVGQGDDVPTAPVTVAVSLADKLDTLCSFFSVGEVPTGSKDPYALRRAAISIISIVEQNILRLPISKFGSFFSAQMIVKLVQEASIALEIFTSERNLINRFTKDVEAYATDTEFAAAGVDEVVRQMQPIKPWIADSLNLVRQDLTDGSQRILTFLADRLKVQQREAGVRHDLIDAVFALGGEDDLVRLLARVKALQAFVTTGEGTNLLAGYKRAANILKQAGQETVSPEPVEGRLPAESRASTSSALTVEEETLASALNTAEPKAAAAIEAEDFEGAMAALASLRAPIDAFFDGVMVNDPDPDKRAYRLGLLTRFRDAVHKVADFSRIEG